MTTINAFVFEELPHFVDTQIAAGRSSSVGQYVCAILADAKQSMETAMLESLQG